MASYKVENVSFRYPVLKKNALDNVSFTVNTGEFICLCGQSGCGKTTLLRLLKPILSPHGRLEGDIFFGDKRIGDLTGVEEASKIGFVMQDIDGQLVTDKVWHELAFGLESLGVPTSEIEHVFRKWQSFLG